VISTSKFESLEQIVLIYYTFRFPIWYSISYYSISMEEIK